MLPGDGRASLEPPPLWRLGRLPDRACLPRAQVDTVRRAFGSDSEGAEKPVEDSELKSGMAGNRVLAQFKNQALSGVAEADGM